MFIWRELLLFSVALDSKDGFMGDMNFIMEKHQVVDKKYEYAE